MATEDTTKLAQAIVGVELSKLAGVEPVVDTGNKENKGGNSINTAPAVNTGSAATVAGSSTKGNVDGGRIGATLNLATAKDEKKKDDKKED